MPFAFATIEEQASALQSDAVSSLALVEEALDRAESRAGRGIFVSLRGDRARTEARAADARRRHGGARSALDGVPIALKDNLIHEDEPCTCASRILEGFVAPYPGTAVQRLLDAGAIVIGRTNMDEFAMGSSCEHSAFGPTPNPWDPERTPGGSSGGSAAAVAAGIVPLAIGSDTGGSIRQPASLCGVSGLKPTYGRISRYGLVAFASSLDQIGPLARTARDCAIGLEIMAGHDARDSTSLPHPVPRYREALSADVSGLVVGLPRECFEAGGVDGEVVARVREAVACLENAGAKVRDVSLPHSRYAVATYYLIAPAEASSNLARYDGARYGRRAAADSLGEMYRRTRSEGFGPEVKRRILLGTYVLSAGYYDAYYRKAMQVRTLLRRDFENAFSACDVLALPTAPEVAFRLGERDRDPLSMYLSDIFTVSANLAGVPALSVPCGFARDLPVGLQLIGAALDETTPLRLADVYQRRTEWHRQRPPERT